MGIVEKADRGRVGSGTSRDKGDPACRPLAFSSDLRHWPRACSGYLRRDKRFGLKIKVLSWGTFLVSRGNNVVTYNAISRAFLLLTSKADKLLLRMEPVSCESRKVIVFK